ncbi:MAG TPA: aminoacyl-tRNA hydrolase [Thermoanaerobaculia bacterium]
MANLILGLGNPGEEYRDTRHNVGFRVVAELARRFGVGFDRFECGAQVAEAAAFEGAPRTLLALPQTYMNRSGYAARCLLEHHGLEPGAVLVVYDEVNLPLGRLRLRRSGSPAGHRGIESVMENLRTDQIPRLRLGVAGPDGPPPGADLADFVLGPFAVDERETLDAAILRAADACECWLHDGVDTAMSRFNG